MFNIDELSWDEECEEHIARHGLRFQDIEEAVYGQLLAFWHRGRLVVLGCTEAGRYITVILAKEGNSIWRPITARDMSSRERQRVISLKLIGKVGR